MRNPLSIRKDERGATAVEYGLILALIFLAIVVGVSNLASTTVGMWNNSTNAVRNA